MRSSLSFIDVYIIRLHTVDHVQNCCSLAHPTPWIGVKKLEVDRGLHALPLASVLPPPTLHRWFYNGIRGGANFSLIVKSNWVQGK